jgi:polyisoprenoid-binding protein YceI
MAFRHSARRVLSHTFAIGFSVAAATAAVAAYGAFATPVTLTSGVVSIVGTSNIHEYTASTKSVRVTRVQLARWVVGPTFWDEIVKPGALEAFDVSIPAASLSSPKEGIDKNMQKALKVTEHPDITFQLRRIEARPGVANGLRAIGLLQIAGVEREVALDLTTGRQDGGLNVHGEVAILMTDFGVVPPKAMLGMLKTDPKVTISFDTLLSVPLT